MIAMAIKGYLRIRIAEIIQHVIIGVYLTIVVATILLA
tara:strand:+ start:676 stop:789 length:114 start_codon:yes stop_codon:yes gene_type:complete